MEKKPPRLSLFQLAELRKLQKPKSKSSSKKSSSKKSSSKKSTSRKKRNAAKRIQAITRGNQTRKSFIKYKKNRIYEQKFKELPDEIKAKIEMEVKKYKKIEKFLDSNLKTLIKYRDFFKSKIVNVFNDQRPKLEKLETIINNIKKLKNKNIDDPKFEEEFDMLKKEIKEILQASVNALDTLLENSIARNSNYISNLIENFYITLTEEDAFNSR